jgi:tRNA1Val (adenine37-N6)-methyltransferase
MGNSVFHFKQFSINQAHSAMKVCTDSCVFGAWVPVEGAKRILDIGCGTGLLSLMMAQRSEALIDAIEPHEGSFLDAKENVALSPWSNRMGVFPFRLEEFNTTTTYDLIVCNPPFYVNHLKSTMDDRNQAWHEDALPMVVLAKFVTENRTSNGRMAVLYPQKEATQFESLMLASGWHVIHKLSICKSEGEAPFRVALLFGVESKPIIEETLAVKIRNNDLATPTFKKWLAPYYAKAIK